MTVQFVDWSNSCFKNSSRFVSDVTFPFQLYNRHMYLRYCTNQTIHSGQNLPKYAAETIQFEVNMTKESRQFLHSHCGHR